jgi:hypothetical protein
MIFFLITSELFFKNNSLVIKKINKKAIFIGLHPVKFFLPLRPQGSYSPAFIMKIKRQKTYLYYLDNDNIIIKLSLFHQWGRENSD